MGKADVPELVLPETLLTSHQVASMLQVNPSSIGNWVTSGRLKAFRTPGGHRRIRGRDLVEFLEIHELPVPMPLSRAMRRRVLWLEANAEARQTLEQKLTQHEHAMEVSFADDVEGALLDVGMVRPHLVVLSVGPDPARVLNAVERLKRHATARGLEVILTAPNPSPALDADARDAGARGCVPTATSVNAVLSALAAS